MIQPNELRLGNKINHNGIVCTILGIDSNSWLQLDNEQLNTMCDDCEYIPLTEEWLLKAGFEKNQWSITGNSITCFFYELNGIVVYIIESGFEVEIKINDNQFNLFKVWNYVHQLQNLYFALTGKELEFKL